MAASSMHRIHSFEMSSKFITLFLKISNIKSCRPGKICKFCIVHSRVLEVGKQNVTHKALYVLGPEKEFHAKHLKFHPIFFTFL